MPAAPMPSISLYLFPRERLPNGPAFLRPAKTGDPPMHPAKSVLSFCALLFLTGSPLPAHTQEKPAQPAVQPAAPKPLPEVQALLDKGDALAKQNKSPDAQKVYEEALTTAQRLRDKSG